MNPQKVIVNICTYKRPQMLQACLDSLLAQVIPSAWTVEILIIDNDRNESAKPLAQQYQQKSTLAVSYFSEKNQGIPFARNRGCDESLAKEADWLLFIDDDETVDTGWLAAYFEATQKYQAEAYTGPVNYLYTKPRAAWLPNKEKSFEDGCLRGRAATNNVLISSKVIHQNGFALRFDTNMAFTGGSDTDLFMRLVAKGGKIIYVRKATVSEIVVENRESLKWLILREYRTTNNLVYIRTKLNGYQKTFLNVTLLSMKHFFHGVLGLIIVPFFILKGSTFFKKRLFQSIRHFVKLTANIAGLINIHPQPYKKTDGS